MKRSLALAARLWFGAGLVLLLSACSDDDDHGRYWEGTAIVPTFAAQQNQLSTSFTGFVHPQKAFIFGLEEGFTLDKPNAKLTLNANSVWAYAPVVVGLYVGPREKVGQSATRIVQWVVPPPTRGGSLQFVADAPLDGRVPTFALVEFPDFSGVTILQVLGHD